MVVHLAFAILDASTATRDLNVEGSRRVFEESVKAGAERICYASSVAAYGFHDDNPDWLTEDIPARGSPEHPYSHQKAEVEQVLAATLLHRRRTSAYVFRPCIVAGPEARTMLEAIPYFRLGEAMPDVVVRLLGSMPALQARDPRSRRALPARARGGRGARVRRRRARRRRAGPLQPGRRRDAHVLAPGRRARLVLGAGPDGWRSRPPPRSPRRLPLTPEAVGWLHSVRKPVLMKTDRARKLLKWRPQHTAPARRSRRWSSAQREEALL